MRIAFVTFDCADTLAQATFWAKVMGWGVSPDSDHKLASVGGPNRRPDSPPMLFLRVPEHKVAKNRVHIDLEAPDLDTEAERLLDLGAVFVHEMNEYGSRWMTFTDPEGNEFCVVAEEPETA